MSTISFAPGPIESAFRSRLRALREQRFIPRLFARDPALWKEDPAHQEVIRGRLGWLDPFDAMEREMDGLLRFASGARSAFRHVLLLGMGGSSLAPEVLARTFGGSAGGLPLRVLDSTDPEAVRAAERGADLETALILVASKSGSTAEIEAFRRHFGSRIQDPARFAAVTDGGSPLDRLAEAEGYLRVFRNPPDIGGRYSALSLFGLVPAALLGIDPRVLLAEGRTMAAACRTPEPVEENAGIPLGAFLAEGALAGRDKATILGSPRFPGFGAWVEQLVAESTGKEGKGILPIDGEPAGRPASYGSDRIFVVLHSSEPEEDLAARAEALVRAGHPVARIVIDPPLALAGEFFRWEAATATASAILGVNPFDEPNVKESKDLTGALLARYAESGRLDEGEPRFEDAELRLFSDEALSVPDGSGAKEWVRAHLARAGRGEFVAFLAFLHPTDTVSERIGGLREAVLDRMRLATSAGFGPRFLHSTGQYFKGGPDRGIFFQLTAEDRADLSIPGLPHSFGVLKRAQALGDFAALTRRGRRVLRVHFKGSPEEGIRRLREFQGG